MNYNIFGGFLMTIDATVIEVYNNRLLVRNLSNQQEILVHFRNALRFTPGDTVRIIFNGRMTFSIPPQIVASSIQSIRHPSTPPPPTSSELRGTVIQRSRNSLLVHEIGTNNQFIVEYQNSYRFFVGQRISIQYETIFLNVPPDRSRIIATNINPLR